MKSHVSSFSEALWIACVLLNRQPIVPCYLCSF